MAYMLGLLNKLRDTVVSVSENAKQFLRTRVVIIFPNLYYVYDFIYSFIRPFMSIRSADAAQQCDEK